MREEHFSKAALRLYYGTFGSRDLKKSLKSGVAVNAAVENLLQSWSDCQTWKDNSEVAKSGRLIHHNDSNVRAIFAGIAETFTDASPSRC
jgi:hypothetical protein